MMPSEFEDWLGEQGVTYEAMAMPPRLGFSHVIYHEQFATLSPTISSGELAIMLPCYAGGNVLDWAAWSPALDKLAVIRNDTGMVGDLDQVTNPATYFDDGALVIHPSPIEWLLAKRQGMVIVNWKRAGTFLASVRKISVPDATFARDLRATVKRTTPEIVRRA